MEWGSVNLLKDIELQGLDAGYDWASFSMIRKKSMFQHFRKINIESI